jgi:hemolysin activation/secretion protein
LPSSSLPRPSDEISTTAGPATSVLVYSFELEGVTQLPLAEVEAQLADLIGQKATLADLRKAADRVTALYRRHGYFLARAYVPAQKVNGGIRITVVEGRYDSVESSGSPRLGDAQIDRTLQAQHVAPGQPIEEKALERSLILLEQRTGAPARAVLRPGADFGTSSLRVEATPGHLFSSSLGADNFGSRYTGELRTVGSVRLNSPLGIGDAGELWGAYSSGARALYASYEAPAGHHGLTLGASYADYHYELCCEFTALERSGDASVVGINARYPLLLNQRSVLNIGLSLQKKQLNDYWLEGDLADRNVSAAMLTLDGIAAVWSGRLRYQAALTGGDLTINGPADFIMVNEATLDTEGNYAKLWGQVEMYQPMSSRSSVSLRLTGQVTSKNLDSSEKFLLGGFNGVRAYPEGEAAGDQAFLARVEWARSLGSSANAGHAAIRAFIDSGTVWIVHDLRGGLADPGIKNHYWLSGAGLGFNWNLPRGLSLNAYVATRIGSNPGRSADGNDADGESSSTRGWLGMEWAF